MHGKQPDQLKRSCSAVLLLRSFPVFVHHQLFSSDQQVTLPQQTVFPRPASNHSSRTIQHSQRCVDIRVRFEPICLCGLVGFRRPFNAADPNLQCRLVEATQPVIALPCRRKKSVSSAERQLTRLLAHPLCCFRQRVS